MPVTAGGDPFTAAETTSEMEASGNFSRRAAIAGVVRIRSPIRLSWMRRRFTGRKKTPNAQRPTPNVELKRGQQAASLEFEVGRSALGVRRFLSWRFGAAMAHA